MRIDSHQHFWAYDRHPDHYVWMGPEQGVLRRDRGPEDLAPLLNEIGFDASIAVQAREMPEETDDLLALARANKRIAGIVGWFDLTDDALERVLEAYSGEKLLVGARMVIHDHPDTDFAASAAHMRGVATLAHCGLPYDLLLKPPHISPATRLVDKVSEQRFVVDHLAKPRLKTGWDAEWAEGIAGLAERPNVFCKLSGLVTEADWADWRSVDYRRYFDFALEIFGAGRLMIGSDWPVCTCAASYAETMNIVIDWTRELSETERAAILGGTCKAFYGVEPRGV